MNPSPGIAWNAGDARAIWIGAVGGSIAVLASAILLAVVATGLTYSARPEVRAHVATYAMIVTLWVLPLVVLVALPTTGYLAASGAATGPGRSGVVAAGVTGLLVLLLCASLTTVVYLVSVRLGGVAFVNSGGLLSFLLAAALPAVLAAGLVMLGVAASAVLG